MANIQKKIHCWDLNIKVTEIKSDLAKEINRKIKNKFKTLKNGAEFYSNQINKSEAHLKNILSWICKGKTKQYKYPYKNQQAGIPILDIITIANDLGINKHKIERNLISIRKSNSHIKIYFPRFPIKITPIASCLLLHYYCDGSHENWCQSIKKHPLNRQRYFQRIENLLGEVRNWNSKKHQEIYTPLIIYKILEKLFGVEKNSFTNIKLPEKFLNLKKEILIGALVAIISDEGHICKEHYEIRIAQKNKETIEFFHAICEKLSYDISQIKKEKSGIYSFKIRSLGLLRFHVDLINLNKKYDNILDLGDKQKFFENKIKIIKNKIEKENLKQPRGHGEKLFKTDFEILKHFKTPITKRELSKITIQSINTLHHRKGRLKNFGLIKVIGWRNKESILEITNKGKEVLEENYNKY